MFAKLPCAFRHWVVFLTIAPLALATFLPSPLEAADSLLLHPGSQTPYTHAKPIRRAAVGDPKIVGITLTSPRSLLLTGKAIGTTTLFVWEGNNPVPAWQARVQVVPLPAHADTEVEALGDGKLKLSGAMPSLDAHAAELTALAPDQTPVDASAAGFDSQVQIDIKVVEVSRQRMMDAGFFLGKQTAGGRARALSGPGALGGISTSGAGGFTLQSSSGFLPFQKAYNLAWGSANDGLFGALSMLENDGFAYTLAEPSLSALSGQTATFLAGGEMPVPTRSGGGADSSISIEYKEFGVRLALTPTVLDEDRIYLKVSPEVSELDESMSVQTGGVAVPGLRVRRTDTSIALANGESFVLSGLVSRSTSNSVDKFPFLGDIPILGAFFRSSRFDRADKELLMIVTAHVVRPFAKGKALPPLPGDAYHNYDPNFFNFLVGAKTPLDPSTGFSQ